jgi:hypothetical protein
LGILPKNIHKALQFIPTRVDAAINRAIERVAARVPAALASSTAGMYKGMLGKEPAPFT